MIKFKIDQGKHSTLRVLALTWQSLIREFLLKGKAQYS